MTGKMFGIIDHVIGAYTVRIHRFLVNISKKPDMNFVIPNLYVGGNGSIDRLSKEGIDAILDLRNEKIDDQEMISKYLINFLHLPIQDREIPSKKQISQALNWIQENLDNKKKVFIHCNLGRGRAPLIVSLYLISKGMNMKESIQKLKKNRKYTFFNKKQLNLIRGFSRK